MRVSDGGSYICLARNDLGSSDEITASVDVRYQARNVRTVPADFLDLEVCKKHRLLIAPPPHPRVVRQVKNHLNEEITPLGLLPTGIG